MKITQHIKVLLSEHDCVIIPDFGAFIADYKSPIVDGEKSSVPGKHVLFNRNLTRNDGLLINAIIELENCTYEEAKLEIAEYVEQIISSLNNGETFIFEGIGSMALDEAGFIQFIEDEENTCLLSAYGLQSIHLEKITKALPEQKTIKGDFVLSNRSLIRIITAAVVVVLLLIFAPSISDKVVVDSAGIVFDSTPTIESLTPSNSVLPKENIPIQSLPLSRKTPTDTLVESNDSTPKPIIVEPTNNYHVIIASLPNKNLADQYISDINNKQGFDALETIVGQGRFRVSAASFTTKEEAISLLNTLHQSGSQFEDAWLLVVKQPNN